jgi:molybdate transport system substrate-binding protein
MSQLVDRRSKRFATLAALAVVASATACGAQPDPTTSITVYAASPLINSFTAIAKEFEAANPRYSVQFVFAGSTDLSASLADGAGADVFASGNTDSMTAVADVGLAAGEPVPFAADRLVIVVPADNPGHVSSAADLSRPGLRVAVCAAQSTCGTATELAEKRTGVHLQSGTSEVTSRGVLKDLTDGKVDAALLFMTDARQAGNAASIIDLPGNVDDVTSWITTIKGSGVSSEATRFVEEVTGPTGKRILKDNGFMEPQKIPMG